ncbi:hypothetical protein WDV93_01450 [Pantoea ananatis]
MVNFIAAQGSKVSVTLLLANGSNGPTINTTTDALGRYAVNFSPALSSVGGLLLSLNTLAKVTITDVAGNSYTTTNTLLLALCCRLPRRQRPSPLRCSHWWTTVQPRRAMIRSQHAVHRRGNADGARGFNADHRSRCGRAGQCVGGQYRRRGGGSR